MVMQVGCAFYVRPKEKNFIPGIKPMTKPDDLRRKVHLILGEYNPALHKIYRHTESEILAEHLRIAKNLGGPPLADLSDTAVVNEQVLLLKTLRGQGGHSEKDFIKVLSNAVTDHNAPVVVHALVELGRLDAVLAILGREKLGPDVAASIWQRLGEKLRREPHRFTDADLEEIDKIRGMEEQLLRLALKARRDAATTL